MKGNSRIIGAILAGVGTWLLATYCRSVQRHHHKRVNKKLATQAHQSWEGEGGTIIDPLPRSATH